MIPETFDRLRNSDRAVSPVIGVILMVAITVILAAVIAAFVLGFGAGADAAPQASLDMSADYDDNEITIEHVSGEAIDLDNVYLRGDTGAGADNESMDDLGVGVDELRGGESITIDHEALDFDEGDDINLVWEVGDESSVLASL